LDGESGGVVVDAHAHLALVGGEVIDAVGDGASEFLDEEIMDAHSLEVALGRHLRPAFLKSPTSSFFLVSTEMTGRRSASAPFVA